MTPNPMASQPAPLISESPMPIFQTLALGGFWALLRAQKPEAVALMDPGLVEMCRRGEAVTQEQYVEAVAQRFRKAAVIENHRRGDHRPGKRPAPGLVNAADQPRAAPFDLEIRHRPLPPGRCAIKGLRRARRVGLC